MKTSILDHVPIEDMVHKENTIRPGPWNNGSKRGPLIAPTIKAGFKSKEHQIKATNYHGKIMKRFFIYF